MTMQLIISKTPPLNGFFCLSPGMPIYTPHTHLDIGDKWPKYSNPLVGSTRPTEGCLHLIQCPIALFNYV